MRNAMLRSQLDVPLTLAYDYELFAWATHGISIEFSLRIFSNRVESC